MADPYWDTIDDGSQVIGSYDITKGERSPIDAFQLEVDRKAQELQDLLDLRDQAKLEAEKAMSYSGRNPIEQAIVGLAPMALGAILGGKQGLGAGGIGAVAGLKAYDSYADEEAKRQQLIASQFYKDAQANVTASQKAMDALRGKQTEMSVDHQNDLEIANLNNAAKMQIKGMDSSNKNQPIRPEVLAGLEPIYGKLPEGITPEELKIQDAAMRQKTNTESADARREQADQSAKRNEANVLKNKKSLEDLQVTGFDWIKMPQKEDKQTVQRLQQAHLATESAFKDLQDIVKKNDGFIVTGGKTKREQDQYAIQQSAIARLTLAMKELYGLGANFTETEQTIVSKLIGTPEAADQDSSIIKGWLTNEMLNRSALEGLNNARAKTTQAYGGGLFNAGAVPKNTDLRQYGEGALALLEREKVQIDRRTGKATYRKPVEEYLQQWDSLSSRKASAPVEQVTSNAKSQAQPKQGQNRSDEVVNKAYDITGSFLKGNPNPTKADIINTLAPQLDALGIPREEQKQIFSIAQETRDGSNSK